jgi:two-component system, sensor histidine kinase LadS
MNRLATRHLWACLALLVALACSLWPPSAKAEAFQGGDLTAQTHFWLDTTGQASINEVQALAQDQLLPMEQVRTFKLGQGALWIRLEMPERDAIQRWYLLLDAANFTDSVQFFQRGPSGTWERQQAGARLPIDQWSIPDHSPTFSVASAAPEAPVWLRMENHPAPLSPRIYLLSEQELQKKRNWTYLLIGGYLGFGLLVMFLGWVHARLYADRTFIAYVVYVGSMLGFQAAFTGLGGLFFWGHWPWWNNAAPALFMFWLVASGIWFVREACSISRLSRKVDRLVLAFSLFGVACAPLYAWLETEALFVTINLYGLLSVILSIALCLWAWRQGERYAGWLLLGFLPVHLGYPFPALRSAGLLPDSWASQYAVLIGSAIEIPLLLYILHRRAKDFNENRARLRALDSTDPLTGLTITPVLRLRLRDAVRRARRYGYSCGLLMVELANHSEILATEGREGGDRALVVSASKLSRVVRDVDTLCRVANTRFAVLIEGPRRPDQIKLLAQHIVAKGLEQASILPGDVNLRFRIVTAMLPLMAQDANEAEAEDWQEQHILKHLDKCLDQLAAASRKSVLHLPQVFAEGQGPMPSVRMPL